LTCELCVVFDVDDTLYPEHDYVVSGFRAVGRWAERWLSIGDFDSRCLDLFDQGRRGNIFNEALRACGRLPVPDLISGLVAIYRSHQPQIGMFDDAATAIREGSSKWPVAIITDGPVISQSLKCEALGLFSLARPVVLTGTMGEGFHKPQPQAFKYVASQVQAARYVYVADNPAKDFAAPRELGWISVRIRRKGGLHYDRSNDTVVPDFELPDCSDLSTILSGIVRHA
jgi:putative hydrolase of the HAD superfamily